MGYTRPHTIAAISAATENIEFLVVPCPPYSPDLAPSDFWLFAALKEHIKGINFTRDEQVQAATGKWFKNSLKISMVNGV